MPNETRNATLLFGLIGLAIVIASISGCTDQQGKESEKNSGDSEMLDYLESRAHPVGWPAPTWELLFNNYMEKNMQYPREAKLNGIEGDVHVSFTVLEDGSLSNFKVTKSLGYGCDEEALRLIRSIGQWQPTVIKGEAKKSDIALQVVFKK